MKNVPSGPDYSGAAREQSQIGRQLTAEQTYANRPDISTPWGGIQWTPPSYDPWYSGNMGLPPTSQGVGGDSGGGGVAGLFGGGTSGGGAMPQGEGQAPGRWGLNLYLSPEQQQALESQQRIGAARSGLAEDLFGRAASELGQAPDFGALPQAGQSVQPWDLPQYDISGAPGLPDVGDVRNRAEEALYQRSTSRLDPEWQARQSQLDVQLRNQGILPGSAAYQQQMADFERAREGAYAGARQEAISGGGTEAQRQFGMGLSARQQAVGEAGQQFGAGLQRAGQGFQQALTSSDYQNQLRQRALAEMLQQRGWSLNEINALLSGQQIGMPQMPGFAQAGAAAAPNLLGAAQSQGQFDLSRFGLQQAQQQAMMSGLGNLAVLPFMF